MITFVPGHKFPCPEGYDPHTSEHTPAVPEVIRDIARRGGCIAVGAYTELLYLLWRKPQTDILELANMSRGTSAEAVEAVNTLKALGYLREVGEGRLAFYATLEVGAQ